MRRSILALSIIVVVLAAVAIFYYAGLVSANHFSKGNISFDYPSNFTLDENPVANESSAGYFICALQSPTHASAIVIYQIPITVGNVTTNKTQNTSSNTTQNVTATKVSNNSSSNTSTNTSSKNNTIQVNINNLQIYLDGVKNRGGNPQVTTKNGYTYYSSGNLTSTFMSYNSSSRLTKIWNVIINETAIVKEGYPNFYVIEVLNGNRTTEGNNAYSQIVNSFQIRG